MARCVDYYLGRPGGPRAHPTGQPSAMAPQRRGAVAAPSRLTQRSRRPCHAAGTRPSTLAFRCGGPGRCRSVPGAGRRHSLDSLPISPGAAAGWGFGSPVRPHQRPETKRSAAVGTPSPQIRRPAPGGEVRAAWFGPWGSTASGGELWLVFYSSQRVDHSKDLAACAVHDDVTAVPLHPASEDEKVAQAAHIAELKTGQVDVHHVHAVQVHSGQPGQQLLIGRYVRLPAEADPDAIGVGRRLDNGAMAPQQGGGSGATAVTQRNRRPATRPARYSRR
jgi:hypothetical protein